MHTFCTHSATSLPRGVRVNKIYLGHIVKTLSYTYIIRHTISLHIMALLRNRTSAGLPKGYQAKVMEVLMYAKYAFGQIFDELGTLYTPKFH